MLNQINRRDFLSVSVVSGAVACLPFRLMASENDKPLTAESMRQLTLDTFPEFPDRPICSIEHWVELFKTFPKGTFKEAQAAFNKFHDNVMKLDKDIATGVFGNGLIRTSATNGQYFYWYIGLARNVAQQWKREKRKEALKNMDGLSEYTKIMRAGPLNMEIKERYCLPKNYEAVMTINKRS